MKLCKYCNSLMMSEHETTGMNGKSYNAFHQCPNCNAVCDEKVIAYRGGRTEVTERWFNPQTQESEEPKKWMTN